MIKRDQIQRVVLTTVEDDQGGNTVSKDPKEYVKAMVSQTTTYKQMNQYGITDQVVLNVVSDSMLDEYVNTRYTWNNKLFKIMRQVKSGNEYFSVLLEVNE